MMACFFPLPFLFPFFSSMSSRAGRCSPCSMRWGPCSRLDCAGGFAAPTRGAARGGQKRGGQKRGPGEMCVPCCCVPRHCARGSGLRCARFSLFGGAKPIRAAEQSRAAESEERRNGLLDRAWRASSASRGEAPSATTVPCRRAEAATHAGQQRGARVRASLETSARHELRARQDLCRPACYVPDRTAPLAGPTVTSSLSHWHSRAVSLDGVSRAQLRWRTCLCPRRRRW